MNFCFISGFSQSSKSLLRLGECLNLAGEKIYTSSQELAVKDRYIDNLNSILKDYQEIVLIGWSMGASIAIDYAVTYPDKVKALVLISASSSYLSSSVNPNGIDPERMQALIKGVINTKEQSLRRFISALSSPSRDELFEDCLLQALSVDSAVLVSNLEYFKKDFSSECSKIKCPTLVIHDSDDRVVPVIQGEELAKLILNSKKFITAGYGHLLHRRLPEVLAREIEKLFRNKLLSVESSFSKAANTYDQNAQAQRDIANHVIEIIPQGKLPKRILDLGTGTGYLATVVQGQFPEAELVISDISAEMLEVAKSKLINVNAICCDFQKLPDIVNLDLIVSSAALHWADSIDAVFKKCYQFLNQNGMFVFSVMLEGTLFELRSIRQKIAPNKKQYPKLHEQFYFRKHLEDCNFKVLSEDLLTNKIYFSSFDELIESLKKTGVTGGGSDRLTRDEFRKLRELYLENYSTEKGLQLTFQAGYFIASKVGQDSDLGIQNVSKGRRS